MSKKSNKANQVRKPVKPVARPTGKPVAGRPVNGKSVNGKPISAKIHGHSHPAEPLVNYQAVRIVAIVVAVLCLAGAITAIALQKVTGDAASIIEMVLVGIIAAFSIFTAVKPEMVSGWVIRLGK